MSISLLPDELRRKEEIEKQKAKDSRLLPTFKMYVPDKQKEGPVNRPVVQPERTSITPQKKIEPALPSKPVFVSEKKALPIETARKFSQQQEKYSKPSSVMNFRKPEMTAQTIKPIERVDQSRKVEMNVPTKNNFEQRKDGRLHYPEEVKTENKEGGKGVVRESADRFLEIKKSPPLSDYLKKDRVATIEPKQMPAEVNLMDKNYADEVSNEFWKRMKSLVSIVTLIILFFAFVFVGIKFYTTGQIKKYNEMEEGLAAAEEEINAFNTESMQGAQLKDRALALEGLLGKHLYWTKFFGFLEKYTAPNVTYTDFVSGDDGEVILMARGKKYSDAADQLFLFQSTDFISTVDINAINLVKRKVGEQEVEEVEFNVRLKLKEDSLFK